MKIGINGFGRIGRCVLRALLNSKLDIEVALINLTGEVKTAAHLYKYDSVYGINSQNVIAKHDHLQIDEKEIPIYCSRNPAEIPWKAYGVEVVLECTGSFTNGPAASAHLTAGAKKVIISAPAKDIDKTIIMGVNHHEYQKNIHHIISSGSCTTNCLAPIAKVIHEGFGIKKGLMTTIHSYTNDQKILDLPHKDLRRARAAGLNIIPTSTGAAKTIGEIIPALAGKLHGCAVRVPSPNVSLLDVTFELETNTTVTQVNALFEKAAHHELKGILGIEFAPLVSHDFNGNILSAIVDAEYTTIIEGNMLKVLAWYDNEWAFSNRMVELLAFI